MVWYKLPFNKVRWKSIIRETKSHLLSDENRKNISDYFEKYVQLSYWSADNHFSYYEWWWGRTSRSISHYYLSTGYSRYYKIILNSNVGKQKCNSNKRSCRFTKLEHCSSAFHVPWSLFFGGLTPSSHPSLCCPARGKEKLDFLNVAVADAGQAAAESSSSDRHRTIACSHLHVFIRQINSSVWRNSAGYVVVQFICLKSSICGRLLPAIVPISRIWRRNQKHLARRRCLLLRRRQSRTELNL